MIHLAIECSGMHGSVAILRGIELLECRLLPHDRSSVQSMALQIQCLLEQTGQSPEFISVTHGPGSFTGLRVGLTTAKMLGLAWNVPIVAVDTLEVMAEQVAGFYSGEPALVVPVLNAFRRQVFVGGWLSCEPQDELHRAAGFRQVALSQVVDATAWAASPCPPQASLSTSEVPGQEVIMSTAVNLPNPDLTPHNCNRNSFDPCKKIVVVGPGLLNYRPAQRCCHCNLPVEVIEDIHPLASAVGLVGWRKHQLGCVESALTLSANYVRASAAEEKLSQ